MPYIDYATRVRLVESPGAQATGELAWELQQTLEAYLDRRIAIKGRLSFQDLAECLGALASAEDDFKERIVRPYERRKRAENDDVWAAGLLDHVAGKVRY